MPYCHVPCYGALFGPQLFGHGTRVESHKSFGKANKTVSNNGPALPRDHLESKLKVIIYLKYYIIFAIMIKMIFIYLFLFNF